MDNEKLLKVLQELLPDRICVAAGPPLATPLTARERESLGAADHNRIREFESGRAYARRALAMLGIHNVDVMIGPDRAPLWPAGVVGSISHVRNHLDSEYFAAAVARTDVALAIGIDVEPEDSLHPSVWSHVLTNRELNYILDLPVSVRRAEAQFLWCAKEATIKTMLQPINPLEIEIERDAKCGGFTATCRASGLIHLPGKLRGRTAYSQGLFLATMVVLPGYCHNPAVNQ
jgi:hypothetical protein